MNIKYIQFWLSPSSNYVGLSEMNRNDELVDASEYINGTNKGFLIHKLYQLLVEQPEWYQDLKWRDH